MKKGIVHLIPVVAIAVLLSIGTIGFVATNRNHNLESNVLSSSDENKGQNQAKGKSEEKSQKQREDKSNTSTNSNSQPSTIKDQSKSEKTKLQNEIKKTTDLKLENEIEKVEENESTQSASPYITPGRKIRTNFPITVNPLTNEKIVTTPSGTKVVILPEVAIQNMIKAGFPVILLPEPSPSPSSSPSESSPSASTIPEASPEIIVPQEEIVLTDFNNELSYEIPAIDEQKFLGLVSVKIKVKGYVSAESGNILKIQKSLFDTILDFLSI